MSYQVNIVQAALANPHFRKELYTTPLTQVVLMCVQPGDDIGLETHHLDQVLVFVAGACDSYLNGVRGHVVAGDLVVVPAGTEHNFVNTGDEPLRLYTVYAPPEHAPGTVHKTKAEAEAAEALEHGHGGHVTAAVPKAPVKNSARYTVGSLLGQAQ